MRHAHENFLVSKILENYNNSKVELQEFYKEKYLVLRKKLEAVKPLEINSKIEWATEYFNEYFIALKRFMREQKFDTPTKIELKNTFFKEMIVHVASNLDVVIKNKLGVYDNIFGGFNISLETYQLQLKNIPVDLAIGKKINATLDSQITIEFVVPLLVVIHKTVLDIATFISVKQDSDAIKKVFPNAKIYVVCDYLNIPPELKSLNEYLAEEMEKHGILDKIFFCRSDEKSSVSSDVLLTFCSYATDVLRIPNYYMHPYSVYLDRIAHFPK